MIQIRCHRPLPSHHRLATAQKPKNKALKARLKMIAMSEKQDENTNLRPS